MRLNPTQFNRFLGAIGQDTTWSKAYACPCVAPHSGSPQPNCPNCHGKGYTWDPAVPAHTGIAGRSQQTTWASFGMYAAGDVVLSIPSDSPLYQIGNYDRVVMLDRSEPFSLNFVAGVNENALAKMVIVSVDRVTYISKNGGAVITVTSPTVNADGTLAWGADRPPPQTTFSITGRRRQEYYCFHDSPWDRPHFSGAALPRNVVLRRFDLFGRS